MAQPKIQIPTEQIRDFCRRNQIRQLLLFGSVLRDDFRKPVIRSSVLASAQVVYAA